MTHVASGAARVAAAPALAACPATSTSTKLAAARADFPALQQQVHGKPLVYLDSAATALKPQAVIDATMAAYQRDCANVHRGVHTLSQRATDHFEAARDTVQAFLGAKAREEIVFVRGATEGINLVAHSFLRPRLQPGDQVVITALEHHANIVPWQLVCEAAGAELVVVPVDARGQVDVDAVDRALTRRTRLLAMAHVSNALGTVLDVQTATAMAHAKGVAVLIDGAQAAPHLPVDVRRLDCDFYVFSGHKVYGPSGIGVLYGKAAWLEAMPPYQGGGDMIDEVRFEGTTYNAPPYKFEAGTPHIAGAIGLGAALDYLQQFSWAELRAHEAALLQHGEALLRAIPGLKLVGEAQHKVAVLNFVIAGCHAHDLGTLVDLEGVALRSGHHCAQPVLRHFGLSATARAALGLYNTAADLNALGAALDKACTLLRRGKL